MSEENTHSLRTQIQLAFETEGSENVGNKLYSDIDDPMMNIEDNLKNFIKLLDDIDAKEPFKRLMDDIERIKFGTVDIDGQKLRDHLANRVAEAITKAQIDFTGEGKGRLDRIDIELGEEFWENNKTNIAEAMARSIGEMEVNPEDFKPLDTKTLIGVFQEKFNEQIVKLIEHTNVFSLYDENATGDIFPRGGAKLELSDKALSGIMGAVQTKVGDVLSDPDNIRIGEIPKLDLGTENLLEIIEKIHESIGEVDKIVGLDSNDLKELPDISEKLQLFRENTEGVVLDLNELAESLSEITIADVDREVIQDTKTAIAELQGVIELSVASVIRDAAVVVDKHLTDGTDLTNLKEAITVINNTIDDIINNKMEVLKAQVETATREHVDGTDAQAKIQELDLLGRITTSIIDELTQVGDMTFSIKQDEIREKFASTEDLVNQMIIAELADAENLMATALSNLVRATTGTVTSEITQIAYDIMNSDQIKATDKDNITQLMNEMGTVVEDYMVSYIRKIIEDVEIGVTGVGVDKELEVPVDFAEKIGQAAQEAIAKTVDSFSQKLRSFEGESDYSGMSEVLDKLDKHKDMIANAVIRDAQRVLTDVRTGYNDKDVVKSVATENLMEKLEQQAGLIAENVVKSVEESLVRAVTISETNGPMAPDSLTSVLTSLNLKVEQYLLTYLRQAVAGLHLNISGTDLYVDLDLPESFINEVSKAAEQALSEAINAFSKEIANFKAPNTVEGLDEVFSSLDKHRTMITNAVLRDVQSTLTSVRKEYLSKDVGEAPATSNIMDRITGQATSITHAVLTTVANSLDYLNSVKDAMEEASAQILESMGSVENAVSEGSISVTPEDVNIDEIVKKIISVSVKHVKEGADKWVPTITPTGMEDISSAVSVKLKDSMKELVTRYAEDIAKNLSVVYDGDSIGESITVDIQKAANEGSERLTQIFVERVTKSKEEFVTSIAEQLETVISQSIESVYSTTSATVGKAVTEVNLDEQSEYAKLATVSIIQTMNTMIAKFATMSVEQLIDIPVNNYIAEREGYDPSGLAELQKGLNNVVDDLIFYTVQDMEKVRYKGLPEIASVDESILIPLADEVGQFVVDIINKNTQAIAAMRKAEIGAANLGDVTEIINTNIRKTMDAYERTINDATKTDGGEIGVDIGKLHPVIRKNIADMFDVTVTELRKTVPRLEGDDASKAIITDNMELVQTEFGDTMAGNLSKLTQEYRSRLKESEIPIETSYLYTMREMMGEVQDSFMSAVMRTLREQVRFLTEELKELRLDARTLGNKTILTKAFSDQARGLAEDYTGNKIDQDSHDIRKVGDDLIITPKNVTMNGVDVVSDNLDVKADGLTASIDQMKSSVGSAVIDGQLVEVNGFEMPKSMGTTGVMDFREFPRGDYSEDPAINRYLSTMLPKLKQQDFDSRNVIGSRHNPLHLADMKIDQDAAPYEGFFKGVGSNMAKYLMVGYMMRLPIKALTEAMEVSKELDYHTAKARENMLIKDPDMRGVASKLVYRQYTEEGREVGTAQYQKDIDTEADNLRKLIMNDMPRELMNIASAYKLEIADVGRFYSIGSRKTDDPYEALTKTREVAKIAAAEEDIDTDFAATGLEALINQWNINIGEVDRYTNIMLKTAMLSNTTITDLLMAQRDTASMFKNRLSGMDDERAYATAMAMSSMFTESSGMSGRQGGTFWRNVITRPYSGEAKEYLEKIATIPGLEGVDPYVERDGKKVQRDYLTLFTNITDAITKLDDESTMETLRELFPLRTIGSAEGIMQLAENMRKDMRETFEILKTDGVYTQDTQYEDITTKQVIEDYVDKILAVKPEDINRYIAGMQQSMDHRWRGMLSQWQTTIFSIFQEIKSGAGSSLVYFENILKMFEDNAHHMSSVLDVFLKLIVGYGAKSLSEGFFSKISEKYGPTTDLPRHIATTYETLRGREMEKDNKALALRNSLAGVGTHMEEVGSAAVRSGERINELTDTITELESIDGKTPEQMDTLTKARHDLSQQQVLDQNIRSLQDRLQETYGATMARSMELDQSRDEDILLGTFLKRSMGARTVMDLEDSFANMIKDEHLYTPIVETVLGMRGKYDDETYSLAMDRKTSLEQEVAEMQSRMFETMSEANIEMAERMAARIAGDEIPWSEMSTAQRNESFNKVFNRIDKDSADNLNELMSRLPASDQEVYSEMLANIDNGYKELANINQAIINMNTERFETTKLMNEATRPVVTGSRVVDGETILETRPKTSVEIADYYRDNVVPAMGLDLDKFDEGMSVLSQMIRTGNLDMEEYEEALRRISAQLGVADGDFEMFAHTVGQVNARVKEGQAPIYEYIEGLNKSRGINLPGEPGERLSGWFREQKSKAEMERLSRQAGGGDGKLISNGFEKLARRGGSAVSNVVDKLSTMISSMFGMAKNLAKVYVVTDLIGTVVSSIADGQMTEGDRMTVGADRLDSSIRAASKWGVGEDDGSVAGVMKQIGGAMNAGYDVIKSGIRQVLGGEGPTVVERMQMWEFVQQNKGMDRDELIYQLQEKMDYPAKAVEAAMKSMEEKLAESPFKDKRTGDFFDKGDIRLTESLTNITKVLEELKRIQEEMNAKIAEISTRTRISEIDLLVKGIAEDSPEITAVRKESVRERSREYRSALEDISLRRELASENKNLEAYTKLDEMYWELKKAIKELELEEYQLNLVPIDRTLNTLSDEVTKLDLERSISESDFQLKFGTDTDTPGFQRIAKEYNNKQINVMERIQAELRSILPQYQGEDRKRVLHNILQIESDKKKLMIDIKDQISEKLGTFNLPSGIEPMTYYEAATRRNTHTPTQITSGNTEVNVIIDNMSGSKEDADRIGKEVAGAVSRAQREVARQLARDVKAGLGRRYQGWAMR